MRREPHAPPPSLRYVALVENQPAAAAKRRGAGKVQHQDENKPQRVIAGLWSEDMLCVFIYLFCVCERDEGFCVEDASSCVFWMISRSQVHVLRWSIFVMAKGLFPRAWVKKSFYFQVINNHCSAIALQSGSALYTVGLCFKLAGLLVFIIIICVCVWGVSHQADSWQWTWISSGLLWWDLWCCFINKYLRNVIADERCLKFMVSGG